jgi:hypothetical protein
MINYLLSLATAVQCQHVDFLTIKEDVHRKFLFRVLSFLIYGLVFTETPRKMRQNQKVINKVPRSGIDGRMFE